MSLSDYLVSAVADYVAGARVDGLLGARPMRLDGFTGEECARIRQRLEPIVSPGRIRILGAVNREADSLINAERATRYRNEVDAGVNRDGFVLIVPRGQLVESSLDEPAFLVVARGALFRAALAGEKARRGFSTSELEALRDAARFKHPESIYAFLTHWSEETGFVSPEASHQLLGLLADSELGGSGDDVKARLRDNARATEILLQTGVSPGRILDELASGLGVTVEHFRAEILDLIAWWQAPTAGAAPAAIDFAIWPRSAPTGPEVKWEPNLSRPPHTGWQDNDGRLEVEPGSAKSVLNWSATSQTPDTNYELELVEETSQQTVARIGRTKSSRRLITWSKVLRGPDIRDELRELSPTGDEEGYLFRIRLKVYVAKQWHAEFESDPFTLAVEDEADERAPVQPAPSAYHALYRFHTEQKAANPSVQGLGADDNQADSQGGMRVVLRADERRREASLDLSPILRDVEQALLRSPRSRGPLHLDLTAGEQWTSIAGSDHAAEHSGAYLDRREHLFELLRQFGSVEAADLRGGDIRAAVLEYVAEFQQSVESLRAHVEHIGGAAADADRVRAASLLGADGVVVRIRPEGEDEAYEILIVAPTHPAVLAWLLTLQDLVHDWSRGRFDRDRKPLYREVVERLAAGPRSMVWPTVSPEGSVQWWGFAGNLTGLWQCFVPIGDGDLLRSLPWEAALTRGLGLHPRTIGMGNLDARRIGGRIKKYAVLHPYVNHLRIAAVMAGDGMSLLDALKVVDERPNTPAGAQSVSNVRYELTLIGPRSNSLGQAIDDMTRSPGDNRWRRYSAAIMDNPETLLAPGFAFARRAVDAKHLWSQVKSELESFNPDGVHIVILGPMLTPSVGIGPLPPQAENVDSLGLSARPAVVQLPALDDSPYVGNWLMQVASGTDGSAPIASKALATVAMACNLSYGTSDAGKRVGLQVALAGPMSEHLRRAHAIGDWVIIADPLFSIAQMDRKRSVRDAILLDFTPEFEPYPGGRVVVTTSALNELEPLADAVGKALSPSGAITAVLASISARLLLNLSNPTKQVVNGLAGLALTREYIRAARPGSLVVPIDGHEDMFVTRRVGGDAKLADLLAVSVRDGVLSLDVYESKWVGKQNLDKKIADAIVQAQTTEEVLRSEYVAYDGVDRQLRIDNLHRVLLFHLERARRHGVETSLDAPTLQEALENENFTQARVTSNIVVWCPDAAGAVDELDHDGTTVTVFEETGITEYGSRMSSWVGSLGEDGAYESSSEAAVRELAEDTTRRDLLDQRDAEVGTEEDVEKNAADGFDATSGSSAPFQGVMSAPGNRDSAPPSAPTPTAGDATKLQSVGTSTDTDECVRLGSVLRTGQVARWCPPTLSNGHLILIGGSGAGKTTALRHITSQLRRDGLPVVVLDFHGDILPVGGEEELFSFDYDGNASFVNPFNVDPQYGARLTPTRLKWEFVEAWRSHYPSLGVHQINFLTELIEAAFAGVGISDDPATWTRQISFQQVLDAFDDSGAAESIKVKIRAYLKRYAEWKVFHGGEGIPVEGMLRRSTRLDLSQLDETARNLVADVVLRRLFLIVRALGPVPADAQGWAKFRAFVVVDEAQLLMGGNAEAKASLSKYAAEARKFGLGLILATQLRDNVPGEIWGNIDTRLFMQALDPVERARNAKAANVPEFTLQSLARGQAILTSSSQPMQKPTAIQIEPAWLAQPEVRD